MKRVKVDLSFVCDEEMDAMPEVEGGRACARCEHVVRDLTAMRQEDALRMLRDAEERGERVCAWQLAGPDGETLFLDSPPERLQLARQLRGATQMMLRAASLMAVFGSWSPPRAGELVGDVLRLEEGAPLEVGIPFYEREEYRQPVSVRKEWLATAGMVDGGQWDKITLEGLGVEYQEDVVAANEAGAMEFEPLTLESRRPRVRPGPNRWMIDVTRSMYFNIVEGHRPPLDWSRVYERHLKDAKRADQIDVSNLGTNGWARSNNTPLENIFAPDDEDE
jgi:hypothetical protein